MPRGAFVTIHRAGELRGCIGRMESVTPLAQLVADMAVSAASADPRFEPVRPDELDDLDLAISVLDPPRPLPSPDDLRIGRDGVLVKLGWNRGVLLPKVAVEHGWDARTFLRHTCLKAGLWPEAWEDPRAVIQAFGAQEFGDDR